MFELRCMKKYLFYLLEVEFLEHGDADLVVQANFCLKLFHPKFGDPWWRENMETFRTCSTSVPSVQKYIFPRSSTFKTFGKLFILTFVLFD